MDTSGTNDPENRVLRNPMIRLAAESHD